MVNRAGEVIFVVFIVLILAYIGYILSRFIPYTSNTLP